MTDDTSTQTPAPKWIVALSVLVFLPPAGLATFFFFDAYGLLETYQRLTSTVILFLGVIWLGAILFSIVRTRNLPSNVFLAALPVVGFRILVISTEQSGIRATIVILASLVGVAAFGMLSAGYAIRLWSLRFQQHQVLSLAQGLTLVILATTTGIIGTTGAGTYLDLFQIRDSVTVNSKSYQLVTFDGLLFSSYVYVYSCNTSGFNCDLIETVGAESISIYDSPEQITWDVSTENGVTVITVFRDDVPLYTEVIE